MHKKYSIWFVLLFFTVSCKDATTQITPPAVTPTVVVKEYEVDYNTLIFADEFDINGKPDSTIWGYDLGNHGWGNKESQNYTNELANAAVSNGTLKINALYENNKYTSARLVTKNKKDFTYGRIEVKAKLPSGVGTWPAIWMLATEDNYGTAYWPDNGEIDIMEHVGFDEGNVHANIHTKDFNHILGTNKGGTKRLNDATEEFHIYSCDWFPTHMVFYIDDVQYFRFTKEVSYFWEKWPFDKPFHLLLNIAVGGSWGGLEGIDQTAFPQSLEIDYVRVYDIKEK